MLLLPPLLAASTAPSPSPLSLDTLWWHAPFLSGGGYCTEASDIVQGLLALGDERRGFRVVLGQHGDAVNEDFVDALPYAEVRVMRRHLAWSVPRMPDPRRAVVVCHSEAGAWGVTEKGALFESYPCPPDFAFHLARPADTPPPRYLVGRTMFETDRIPDGWAARCNEMDEVWVPTEFHRKSFADSGVDRSRLFVVPEGVDTAFFDPDKRRSPYRVKHPRLGKGSFVFLSVFKWERRKGWDALLRAFLTEFGEGEDVCLVIKTSTFHSEDDHFYRQIKRFARDELGVDWAARKPCIKVISTFVDKAELPGLYARADCLVQPSRGEGWGRPHMEAMSMGLPVISTNWSGVTAYMHDGNALLVSATARAVPDGAFAGHIWGDPDVASLREKMRWAVDEQRSGGSRLAEIAARGRDEVRRRFNLRRVGDVVRWHFHRIRTGDGSDPPYVEDAAADLRLLGESAKDEL